MYEKYLVGRGKKTQLYLPMLELCEEKKEEQAKHEYRCSGFSALEEITREASVLS